VQVQSSFPYVTHRRQKTYGGKKTSDMTLGLPDIDADYYGHEDDSAEDGDSEALEEEADFEGAVSSPAGGWPETQESTLDAPSSPPYSGPSSSPARNAVAATSNTPVEPVFALTLQYLTKQFTTPFNLQYLGTEHGCLMFSDGVHVLPATVGSSYKYLFKSNTIQPMSFVTIFIVTRGRKAPFNLKFTNLRMAPKRLQTYRKFGNPTPY
jgi:hypothetical protein